MRPVGADGTGLRTVRVPGWRQAFGEGLGWSPDGRLLTLARHADVGKPTVGLYADARGRIGVLDVRTGAVRAVARAPAGAWLSGCWWR